MAKSAPPILDRLISPLGDCLTVEAARRVVKLRADDQLQRRIYELGKKCKGGALTDVERDEYETIVGYTNFVSLLQSKARKILTAGDV